MSEGPRLPDRMEQNARVEVRVDGTTVGTRRIIDFVSSGGNADDAVNDIVTVEMTAGGGDLWQTDGSTLQPVTAPDEFYVAGSDGSNLDLIGGDLTVVTLNDINLGPVRDMNTQSGRDTDIEATRNLTLFAAGNVGIDSTGITDVAGGTLTLKAPSSAPTDANITNNRVSFYLDEGTNTLKVRVRYAGGTYKTGSIALT